MRLNSSECLVNTNGTAKWGMNTLRSWHEHDFVQSFLAATLDRSRLSLLVLGGAG
jgi:hypothetical protein